MAILQEFHIIGSRIRHSRLLRNYDWFWGKVVPAWHRVSLAVYRRRGLSVYLNGDVLRLDVRFGSPFGRHAPRTYEPAVYRAFTGAVRRGMRVFDIGAHIGIFTLGATKRIGRGVVYAFEPLPENAAVLRRHIVLNGCEDRVEVVQAVVSDVDARIPFYVAGVTNMASLGKANPVMLSDSTLDQPVRETEVESVTLDTFCKRSKVAPDVLKIDVEGAELHVLRGARSLLRNTSPVIFCELHPRQMLNCGSSLLELETFLEEIDYVLEPLDAPNEAGIFHGRLLRRAGKDHRPVNRGVRFARNAATPSLKSALE